MTNVHEEIEKILLKYGEAQTNLLSDSARKMIADDICTRILSRSKTAMLEEIKALRGEVELMRDQVVSWPPNDVY